MLERVAIGATAEVPPCPARHDRSEGARLDRIGWLGERFAELEAVVAPALLGKEQVVRRALTCLLAGGHLLVDDVPGVGKTSLARAIAAATAGSVQRIQGTTDLLPADITGTQIWNPGTRAFEFVPGPVFANVVIVDEINRMPPRSQSALLEVMAERQVSAGGVPRSVPSPFFIVATQNPVDLDSTYRLPEAQLDRFLMCLSVGYPPVEDEVEVALRQAVGGEERAPVPAMDGDTLTAMIAVRREVHISRPLVRYGVELCAATRSLPGLRLGAGPRASGALVAGAQACAGAEGRAFATADDVKAVAPHVLGHRLLPTAEAELDGADPASLLAELLATVPLPRNRSDR
jgi:MoxR-like ATPase